MKYQTTLFGSAVLIAGLAGFLIGVKTGNSVKGFSTVAAQSEIDRPMRQRVCADGLLQGAYAFKAEGNIIEGSASPLGPYATVGVFNFDGLGKLTLSVTQSYNGRIVGPTNVTGVYTLGDDCQGRITLNTGAIFNVVASDNGRELYLIQINNGSALSGIAKRLS